MRGWLVLTFVVASGLWSPTAFAHPNQPPDVLAEIDASLVPQALSTRAILTMELPRVVVSANPRVKRTILDNPFMRVLFKGVRMPGLSTARAQLRAPDERIVMLAVRPRGAGGVLRFRVRFDSALFHNRGPLRHLLRMRRTDL